MAPRTRMTPADTAIQRVQRRREWEARTGLSLTPVEEYERMHIEQKTDPIEGRKFLGRLLFGRLRRART